MIRQTLAATAAATFCVELPDPNRQGMPVPSGTGFFVAPEGWFVTAAHVVALPDGTPRSDLNDGWLMKEPRPSLGRGSRFRWPELIHYDRDADFALLRVDFDRHRGKESLKGRKDFPHVRISSRTLEEGEPVYAFGYPLPDVEYWGGTGIAMGISTLRPRTTSAIVASVVEEAGMVSARSDIETYVVDKALNYGNSGGPIVASETGFVHAFCSRFQPVHIPQPHINDQDGHPLVVMIPSLYGVVTSMNSGRIRQVLAREGIGFSDE